MDPLYSLVPPPKIGQPSSSSNLLFPVIFLIASLYKSLSTSLAIATSSDNIAFLFYKEFSSNVA
jgi:hypothetical protein